jgi:hypothetical protein
MRCEVISYFLVGIFSVIASINLSRDKISNDSATIIFFIFTIGPFVGLLFLFLYVKLKPNYQNDSIANGDQFDLTKTLKSRSNNESNSEIISSEQLKNCVSIETLLTINKRKNGKKSKNEEKSEKLTKIET